MLPGRWTEPGLDEKFVSELSLTAISATDFAFIPMQPGFFLLAAQTGCLDILNWLMSSQ